jgi:hypothetical protein
MCELWNQLRRKMREAGLLNRRHPNQGVSNWAAGSEMMGRETENKFKLERLT